MKVKGFNKRILVCVAAVVAVIAIVVGLCACQQKQQAEVKTAVPFSEVKVDGGLMRDYTKLVICNVIPTAIANVEKAEGGIPNIKNCALWHEGKIKERPTHQGAKYVDSDVHKVLESMCMALDTDAAGDKEILAAQAKIAAKLNEWIEYYTWAPEQDGEYAGYFNSYYSLEPTYEKYSNTDNHELYCQGHFIEAAVAHYRYTMHQGNPDPALLNVAINCANHICDTFGNDKRKQMTGHQELELALPKLAKLCQEIGSPYDARAQEYIDKAAFFLGVRGDYANRSTDDDADMRAYFQDHAKVEDQMEPVGHAVRAQYMYTGMCDLAAMDSSYYQKYDKALTTLWDCLTNKKQYINGGLGDTSNENEGFADEYYLPNYSSYCETCAGVANMLWNRSMSTIYDGSQYADQIETDLYNNILGCVNFDGNAFYYENRLATVDAFQRKTWFGTACCPPNFMRTILQVGGYIYNTTSNDVFVNQYISNTANFNIGDNKVNIKMTSNFPYQGNGTIVVKPAQSGNFGVQLRKPSWTDSYTIKVNGAAANTTEKDGYIIINQDWDAQGSTIEFDFSMPIKYETMNENVTFDNGFLAVKHGPILYCAEECDNPGIKLTSAIVERSDAGNFEYVSSLDGKANPFGVRSVYTLSQPGKILNGSQSQSITWKLIPYYARCNRANSGGMSVFLHDGNATVKVSQRAHASAKFTYSGDSVEALNDGVLEPEVRWTDKDDPALNPWVQYNFDQPISFKDFRIYWYEYYKDIVTPWRLTIYVKNSQTGEEYSKEFKNGEIPMINKMRCGDYSMDDVVTGDEIRVEIHNEHGERPVGIVEWEIFEAN